MESSSKNYHTDIFEAGTSERPIWDNYKSLAGLPVTFIHLSQLATFIAEVKSSDRKLVLVTDNFCDHSLIQIGDRVEIIHRVMGTRHPGFSLPLPEQIIHWFGQNMDMNIPGKTSPQFVGVLAVDQYQDFVRKHPEFLPKTGLCYMNFGFTSPLRNFVYDQLRGKDFVTDGIAGVLNDPGMHYFTEKFYRFYLDTASHRYAIVPPGHGIDTFRLYETLLMRTIPVVLDSPFYRHFEEWPVLIVPDYGMLTREYLEERYDEINRKFNWFYKRLSKSAIMAEIAEKANGRE